MRQSIRFVFVVRQFGDSESVARQAADRIGQIGGIWGSGSSEAALAMNEKRLASMRRLGLGCRTPGIGTDGTQVVSGHSPEGQGIDPGPLFQDLAEAGFQLVDAVVFARAELRRPQGASEDAPAVPTGRTLYALRLVYASPEMVDEMRRSNDAEVVASANDPTRWTRAELYVAGVQAYKACHCHHNPDGTVGVTFPFIFSKTDPVPRNRIRFVAGYVSSEAVPAAPPRNDRGSEIPAGSRHRGPDRGVQNRPGYGQGQGWRNR